MDKKNVFLVISFYYRKILFSLLSSGLHYWAFEQETLLISTEEDGNSTSCPSCHFNFSLTEEMCEDKFSRGIHVTSGMFIATYFICVY